MNSEKISKNCYYAIGDIHGCYKLLVNIMGKIESDINNDINNTLIFLGDYIDRGKDSKKVIDL
tara:strand:- start:1674 stop:1862 length:189 start_codon:yes stop_codon:yes gene_type:complete